jgi:cadmium resistance protein CadD (predicted permease)
LVLATLGLALAAFVSTNIDDLVVLSAFFATRQLRTWQVVVGQYIGISALVALSLLGGAVTQLFPEHLTRWLGILPILIGLKWLIDQLRHAEISPFDLVREPENTQAITSVALVTVSNGGDNISVYVPLFAAMDRPDSVVTILVFMLMTAIWCAASFALVRNPVIGHRVTAAARWAAPVVLICIGVGIILGIL